jgi:4-methylaminobutanoate oxidase (formaldehyde-forming)
MGYVSFAAGVTKEWLATGTWEVEVACKRYPAKVQLEPFYDPKNERIKA